MSLIGIYYCILLPTVFVFPQGHNVLPAQVAGGSSADLGPGSVRGSALSVCWIEFPLGPFGDISGHALGWTCERAGKRLLSCHEGKSKYCDGGEGANFWTTRIQ